MLTSLLCPSSLDIVFSIFPEKEGFQILEKRSGDLEIFAHGMTMTMSEYHGNGMQKGVLTSNVPVLPRHTFHATYTSKVDLIGNLAYVKQTLKSSASRLWTNLGDQGWAHRESIFALTLASDYLVTTWQSSPYDRPQFVSGVEHGKVEIDYLLDAVTEVWIPEIIGNPENRFFWTLTGKEVFYSREHWWTRDGTKHSTLLHACIHSEHHKRFY